ncbi:uncharacterized protein LOC113590183 isoform X2 [Electrophorus electricus]|uniref:uncharacterized protein LOC113590183 isoform X2 n=1 Tax=Electrophorus electricus TaxID=8005 RepID=UPI0015D0038A|nr:uncharacterized protein LOC113590183 isoform X2 [Electrophorus electricus]
MQCEDLCDRGCIFTHFSISGTLDKSVSCLRQTVCALRESEIILRCNYPNINIKKKIWISPKQKDTWRDQEHPEDLSSDVDYKGRVSDTKTTANSSTLKITGLKHTDSGEYHFLLITANEEKYISSKAISLTVADLQVRMTSDQSGKTVNLTCSTSCQLTYEPDYYFWYKNNIYLQLFTPYKNPKPLVLSSKTDSGNYSCGVNSWNIKSPAVEVSLGVSYKTRNSEYNIQITTQSGRIFSASPGVTSPGSPEKGLEEIMMLIFITVFLALGLIIGALWVWRRNSSSAKGHKKTGAGEQSDPMSAQAMSSDALKKASSPGDGEIQYASIHFIPHCRQEESSLPPSKLPIDTTEGDSVQYAAVNFKRDTTATQSMIMCQQLGFHGMWFTAFS